MDLRCTPSQCNVFLCGTCTADFERKKHNRRVQFLSRISLTVSSLQVIFLNKSLFYFPFFWGEGGGVNLYFLFLKVTGI